MNSRPRSRPAPAARARRLGGLVAAVLVGSACLLPAAEDVAGQEGTARPASDRPAGAGSAEGGAEGDREVVELEFTGNRAFSDRQLAAAIATQETRCRSFVLQLFCGLTDWGFAHDRAYLDPVELPRDVLRLRVFYRQRGYRSARVDTTVARTDGEVRVGFRIEEGEPVRVDSLRIRGLRGILDEETLLAEIEIGAGDPFDRIRLDAAKQLITDRLQNRGYVNAEVLEETFLPEGSGARTTLDVHPGERVRIGEIRIEGAGDVGENVVRQFLTFRTGEYLDQEAILASQRALYDLEALRFANIGRASELSPGDTVVDIRVQVTEAATRTVRVGTGVSTTECAVGETRFTHRNFLGGARRLELTARMSNILAQEVGSTFPCTDTGDDDVFRQLNFRLRGEFQQPYFFSSRNSFQGAVFFERETVPDIFVRTSNGAELAFTRRVRLRMPVTLSYRPEFTGFDEESADIFFCVNFGFCQPEDIRVLTDRRWLSPLALSWRYDRTNQPFSPTRGYYASLEVEGADQYTGSAYQYVRFLVEAADFEEVSPGLVLAAHVRGGFVEPTGGLAFDPDPERAGEVVHPRKRFFAGGAQSVRGFGQNLLGPTVLVVDSAAQCADTPLPQCAEDLALADPGAFDERPVGGNAAFEMSVELRKSLGGSWGVVGFVDLGQVWRDLTDLQAPVLTPGAGIRYRSPLGPFRLDLAYDPSGAEMLPVVAQVGGGEIRELGTTVRYDPYTFDRAGTLRELFRRLRFQLSIGEAF